MGSDKEAASLSEIIERLNTLVAGETMDGKDILQIFCSAMKTK